MHSKGNSRSLSKWCPVIEGLPNVPPAFVLIARELPSCNSWSQARKRVKGMLRELRDQSEGFAVENADRAGDSANAGLFGIHLHGPLDLLTGEGCSDNNCRVAAANRIARSLGLLADRIWLTDLLTEKFFDFGRPTNEKLDQVIRDVCVVAQLMPLINAGIVKFRSPLISTCTSCLSAFEDQLETLTQDMWKEFKSEFQVKRRKDGGYDAHFGSSTEPAMILCSPPKQARIPSKRRFALPWVYRQVRGALWIAREATSTGGAIFSSSRLGLSSFLKSEGRYTSKSALALLDTNRSLVVPWVSELNAAQVLQLRQEASSALPIFREKMCGAMTVLDPTLSTSNSGPALIAELREQAAEVRSELDAKRKSSGRFWKTTYGILGLGLSAYGIATDQVVAEISGLLHLIGLQMTHKAGHESEVAKIRRRPGYVLVKAKDILAHADF